MFVRVDLVWGGGGGGGRGRVRVLGVVEEGKVVVTSGHGRRQLTETETDVKTWRR